MSRAAADPVRDLAAVLATLTISRRDDAVAVCAVDEPPDAPVLAMVEEPGGTTVVVALSDAERLGLTVGLAAVWLTVDVRTALDGVGVTAALSRALADADVACNVLAGFHHDHLLVPAADADRAIAVLEALRTG